MKLELKHIAPYLPYGLKIASIHKDWQTIFELDTYSTMRGDGIEKREIYSVISNQYKPILRPLSDLTKEIEIDGVKFIPIIAICKIICDIHNDDMDSDFKIKDDGRIIVKTPWDIRFEMFYKGESLNFSYYDIYNFKEKRIHNPYLAYQKLFEWHFDCFNLIPNGLAIDINTLK